MKIYFVRHFTHITHIPSKVYLPNENDGSEIEIIHFGFNENDIYNK